jgi:DNA polymerase-3 subunit delta'
VKKEIITREINSLSHAYLVLGDSDDSGIFLQDFSLALGISKSDLFILDQDDSIKIGEIRVLQRQINLTPHSSKFKLAVIKNASKLTNEASNALLKILEEPPKSSIIMLITRNVDDLLPTVVSRLRKIKITKKISSVKEDDRDAIKSFYNMSIKEKFDFAYNISKQNNISEILDGWLLVLREEMLAGKNRKNIIKKIINVKKMLNANINKRLAIENILLEFK